MTISAYVLIECSRDPAEVVRVIRQIVGVLRADALFGPLDAIAVVEAGDMRELEETLRKIHGVDGLKSGDTRIARTTV